MRLFHSYMAIVLVALVGCASAGSSEEGRLLKSFALAQCLARAYPDTPMALDARAAASGYLEFGSVGAESYAEVVELADAALKRPYQGKDGEPLHVMKCIDFALGAELDAHVQLEVTGKRDCPSC